MHYTTSNGCTRPVMEPLEYNNKSNQIKSKLCVNAFKMTEYVTKLSKNAVPKYKTRYSTIRIVWGREAST